MTAVKDHDTGESAPARSAARLAAVQALYQMETAGAGVDATITEFEDFRLGGEIEGDQLHRADKVFFADILRGAVETQRRIDPYIERQLAAGWKLSRIDATARAILRAGLYELIRRADVPYKVVIDEYINIANAFFDGDEPKFINGVLDAAAREARSDELTL
ncbi:MAG: transcription antitermination factor NusB [Marinicaulis sp.]|nr:transcription antitermination factor NusB [Marinicaulis sp.]NNE40499.1 transcription antitermination factor NusB [Marinicaulis sp.]NNL89545.1 transcription antitermination factor NusB [Marinicaulis sp.]